MIESEEIFVCAGICRIDPETSTCVGCGRPVGELARPADALSVEPAPPQPAGVDSAKKAS